MYFANFPIILGTCSFSLLLIVLLCFTQLIADAMGGVHLQQRPYQQSYHPVVVEDIDIGRVSRDGMVKQGLENMVAVFHHKRSRTDETGQGKKLDAAQTAQRDVASIVSLAYLHNSEEQTSHQNEEAGHALEYKEHIEARSQHHENSTCQE